MVDPFKVSVGKCGELISILNSVHCLLHGYTVEYLGSTVNSTRSRHSPSTSYFSLLLYKSKIQNPCRYATHYAKTLDDWANFGCYDFRGIVKYTKKKFKKIR